MNYLKIGTAKDLKDKKERFLFRCLEIFPGALSWGILIAAIVLSSKKPFFIAVFIISFAIFWFFRSIYFSFHLWSGYKKMAKHEKTNWIRKISAIKEWEDIYHLIVIPMYKEPLEIVKENFEAICKSDYPKEKMIVILACEEAARNEVLSTAIEIEKEFSSKFFKFMVSWHPENIPHEIQGKGANETWAAKKAKKEIIDPLKIPYGKIIFSSFDVDTCIFKKYFSCLTFHYLTAEKPTRTSFQPIPLFINNIWQAPAFSRLFSFSSTFWHTMNQERPEKLITFSSHSMSFKALVDIDFKQTNVVSDDSRIFWQCFLKYDGDYRTVPLYYPISMDANVAKSFFRTLINIYKQQRRWAYGCGDIAYFLFGFFKNKKIPFWKKISLSFEVIEGHISWATASILIFILGWLPILIGGMEFSQTVISYNLPRVMGRVLAVAMLGLISSSYLSFILLPPRPPSFGRYKYVFFLFSWVLFPPTMLFFASIPSLDAQTRWMLGKYMGFWPTEKVRKKQ
ncbi:MAG: glycosyltransferase family 2 protein [Candidatus Pacebacteria bacterium]|nr:glycosyltransferase family 2 protein [Candidatus Paceibacterota bacterium]